MLRKNKINGNKKKCNEATKLPGKRVNLKWLIFIRRKTQVYCIRDVVSDFHPSSDGYANFNHVFQTQTNLA